MLFKKATVRVARIYSYGFGLLSLLTMLSGQPDLATLFIFVALFCTLWGPYLKESIVQEERWKRFKGE